MQIVVLSTFDPWPPRDGGQTRICNIWTRLPPNIRVSILVYDFRNASVARTYKLNDAVEVVVPIASFGDANHFHHMMAQTSLWLHDALCVDDYNFSAEFLTEVRERVTKADVVVASHPYLAVVAFPFGRPDAVKIYESHNVECDVKTDYFKSGTDQKLLSRLLESVIFAESFAMQSSDRVTAVSESDADRLATIYNVSRTKITVSPNGCEIPFASPVRKELDTPSPFTPGPVGAFIGSAYPANVESYLKARSLLNEIKFGGTIVLVGSIASADRSRWPEVCFNERWLGYVSDEIKTAVLASSDFALQLIYAGAGTNLKLFDYMGHCLPIIANEFGVRGVPDDGWCWKVETADDLAHAIEAILQGGDDVDRRVRCAHEIVWRSYHWDVAAKVIATAVGAQGR